MTETFYRIRRKSDGAWMLECGRWLTRFVKYPENSDLYPYDFSARAARCRAKRRGEGCEIVEFDVREEIRLECKGHVRMPDQAG